MRSFEGYDFIDFGASKGGSLRFAAGAFGGRGIGVDINPRKIAKLEAAGGEAFLGDATNLDLPDRTFRYATAMNFLEHLSGYEMGEKVIRQAVRVARDFVYIMGPDFDDLDYLASLGLKKYYADWHGHSWHHTSDDFDRILKPLGVRYTIVRYSRIRHANDPYLLPLDAPQDSNGYDPKLHSPKPDIRIRKPVYGWVTAVVALKPEIELSDILCRSMGFQVKPAHPSFG